MISDYLLNKTRHKAEKLNKSLTYRVIAIGFDKKMNFLGIKSNGFSENKISRYGNGKHAERELIKRFGKKIDKIVILRFGRSGSLLPIEPCEICQKVAQKYNIKIISF
jgi:hypothetical protein